jgi:hypothetical protein
VCAVWEIVAWPASTMPPVGSSAAERVSMPLSSAKKTNKKYFFVKEKIVEIF